MKSAGSLNPLFIKRPNIHTGIFFIFFFLWLLCGDVLVVLTEAAAVAAVVLRGVSFISRLTRSD